MTARRKNSGSGDGKLTSRAASGEDGHEWEFKARFRRHAFGWRSQPAITRIKQAVTEITKVARKDPMLAAEGAIAFLERVSPAIEHADGSSGSIGTAVNNAVAELVPIIAGAPADAQTRDTWLERLWEAYQADEMPYIESLGDYWGELPVRASVETIVAGALPAASPGRCGSRPRVRRPCPAAGRSTVAVTRSRAARVMLLAARVSRRIAWWQTFAEDHP